MTRRAKKKLLQLNRKCYQLDQPSPVDSIHASPWYRGKRSKHATFPNVISFTSEDLQNKVHCWATQGPGSGVTSKSTNTNKQYSIQYVTFLLFWVHLVLFISKHSDVSLFMMALSCSEKLNVPQPNKMQECEEKGSGEEPSVAILSMLCQWLARNH